MKKYQITLSVLLALATVFSVACGDSKTATTIPTFTKLSFLSDRTVDPTTPLFLANLDGTSPAGILTNNGDWTYSPSTSADLTVLAYTSDAEIFVTNTAGSTTPTQITDNTASGFYTEFVRVSPDGTLLLSSIYNGTNYHMFIMKPDGTASIDLTPTPPTGMTDCYSGSFSADGTKIVFACYDGVSNAGLYSMNADGTGTTTIYTAVAFFDDAMFTADATKVLFVDYTGESAAAHRRSLKIAPHTAVRSHVAHGTTQTYGIDSVNLDGSSLTVLVPNAYEGAILNSTLYYTIYDTDLDLDQIYKANVDGTGAVSISDGTSDDYLGLSND